MFYGSYYHTLDVKGRLIVPAKFRLQLGEKCYILKGYDGSLSVYKESDFSKYLVSLDELPFAKKDARDIRRIALSSVSELEIDKQGRVQLPSALLVKYAIGRNVVVVGVSDHIEIWDQAKWEQYLKDNEKDFEEKSEALSIE